MYSARERHSRLVFEAMEHREIYAVLLAHRGDLWAGPLFLSGMSEEDSAAIAN